MYIAILKDEPHSSQKELYTFLISTINSNPGFESIGQPKNDMPSCQIAVLWSCITKGRDPTQSTFVYRNHLYVNDLRCQVYEWYVIQKPCNVYSSKGKQAGWVIHMLGQFYSPVATFRMYSGFFRWLERSGCLPQVHTDNECSTLSEVILFVYMNMNEV